MEILSFNADRKLKRQPMVIICRTKNGREIYACV